MWIHIPVFFVCVCIRCRRTRSEGVTIRQSWRVERESSWDISCHSNDSTTKIMPNLVCKVVLHVQNCILLWSSKPTKSVLCRAWRNIVTLFLLLSRRIRFLHQSRYGSINPKQLVSTLSLGHGIFKSIQKRLETKSILAELTNWCPLHQS